MITAPIVAQIDPVILFIEGQPKRPEKFGAAGLLLRAHPADLQHGAAKSTRRRAT